MKTDEERRCYESKYAIYQPRAIKTDFPAEGVIRMYEPAGEIFNQPMLVIDEIPHWIPAHDCQILNQKPQ